MPTLNSEKIIGCYALDDSNLEKSLSIIVRIDIDGYSPQHYISIETIDKKRSVESIAHVIAKVKNDDKKLDQRKITALVIYSYGNKDLIPEKDIIFEVKIIDDTSSTFALTLVDNGAQRSYPLKKISEFFDGIEIEYEIDHVKGAPKLVTEYNPHSHPIAPRGLGNKEITIDSIFAQVGFKMKSSRRTSDRKEIPNDISGEDSVWSTEELHNAMATYWSRASANPDWSIWILGAALHENNTYCGLMFDSSDSKKRQGLAIFANSFLMNPPDDETNKEAWVERRKFFTLIHEMGHTFNLQHSFLGLTELRKIILDTEGILPSKESRSFMNYPNSVTSGQNAFFSDFKFCFSDDELIFLRHAPRDFIRMGSSILLTEGQNQFASNPNKSESWKFEISAIREDAMYDYLEPVRIEFKLTNISDRTRTIDRNKLSDPNHIYATIHNIDAKTCHLWKPMGNYCYLEADQMSIKANECTSLSYILSISSDRKWLIQDPGKYCIHAILDLDGEILVSNDLVIEKTKPSKTDERIAQDFTKDVASAVVFGSVETLPTVENTLRDIIIEYKKSKPIIAINADYILLKSKLKNYKLLDFDEKGSPKIRLKRADNDDAKKNLGDLLKKDTKLAIEAFGKISYQNKLDLFKELKTDIGNLASIRNK